VTHPFHPWFNRKFVFIGIRQAWGDNRVFFLDAEGVQHCLPVPWTDAAEPDVFVVMAAGRCAFRVDDLIALAGLIEGLRGAHPAQCKDDCAAVVREISPHLVARLTGSGLKALIYQPHFALRPCHCLTSA